MPVVDHPHASTLAMPLGRPTDFAQTPAAGNDGPGGWVTAEMILQFDIVVLPEVAQHAGRESRDLDEFHLFMLRQWRNKAIRNCDHSAAIW